ncbi:MAG: hypothetical protein V3T41_05320 [bacterium]
MVTQKAIRFTVRTTPDNAESDVQAMATQKFKEELPEILGPLAAPLAPVLGEIFGKSAARQLKKAPSGIPTREEILATKPYRRVAPEFAGALVDYIDAMKHNPSLNLIEGQTIIAGRTYRDLRKIDLEFLDMGYVYLNLAYGDTFPEAHYLRPAMKAALQAWWEVLNHKYPPTQRVGFAGRGVTADPHTWPGKIYLSSGYRPLGTDMKDYGDDDGIFDSYDLWGHWNGYAVDIPRKETAWAFNIPGTVAEVQRVMEETGESVGLKRLRNRKGEVREDEHHHFFITD